MLAYDSTEENARSPYDAVLISLAGGDFSIADDDGSEQDGVQMVMISLIYSGARPWIALKVMRIILNMICWIRCR